MGYKAKKMKDIETSESCSLFYYYAQWRRSVFTGKSNQLSRAENDQNDDRAVKNSTVRHTVLNETHKIEDSSHAPYDSREQSNPTNSYFVQGGQRPQNVIRSVSEPTTDYYRPENQLAPPARYPFQHPEHLSQAGQWSNYYHPPQHFVPPVLKSDIGGQNTQVILITAPNHASHFNKTSPTTSNVRITSIGQTDQTPKLPQMNVSMPERYRLINAHFKQTHDDTLQHEPLHKRSYISKTPQSPNVRFASTNIVIQKEHTEPKPDQEVGQCDSVVKLGNTTKESVFQQQEKANAEPDNTDNASQINPTSTNGQLPSICNTSDLIPLSEDKTGEISLRGSNLQSHTYSDHELQDQDGEISLLTNQNDLPYPTDRQNKIERANIPSKQENDNEIKRTDIQSYQKSVNEVKGPDIPSKQESANGIEETDIPSKQESVNEIEGTDIPYKQESVNKIEGTDTQSKQESVNDIEGTDIPSEQESANEIERTDIPSKQESVNEIEVTDTQSNQENVNEIKQTDIPSEQESENEIERTDIPSKQESVNDIEGTDIPSEQESENEIERTDIPSKQKSINEIEGTDTQSQQESVNEIKGTDIPSKQGTDNEIERTDIPSKHESVNEIEGTDIPSKQETVNEIERIDIPSKQESVNEIEEPDIPSKQESVNEIEGTDIPSKQESVNEIEEPDIPSKQESLNEIERTDSQSNQETVNEIERIDIQSTQEGVKNIEETDIQYKQKILMNKRNRDGDKNGQFGF